MSNLNNDGLFEQVLQAQETQREGWMAEIPTIAPTPITDELLAGREHGNAIEFLACDLERELAVKDAEIDRLKGEVEFARHQRDQWRSDDFHHSEYIKKLGKLLGCEDGDTTPEMQIDRLKKDLEEGDGKITSLSNALDDAISLIDRCSIDETPGDFSSTYYAISEVLKAHKALTSQRQ